MVNVAHRLLYCSDKNKGKFSFQHAPEIHTNQIREVVSPVQKPLIHSMNRVLWNSAFVMKCKPTFSVFAKHFSRAVLVWNLVNPFKLF